MPAFPIAMLGAQTGMNIWDKIQSARATKDMSRFLDERESDINSKYFSRINENYLDTAEAGGIMKRIGDNFEEGLGAMENNAISSGATAEAKIAAKDDAQENYAGALSTLAGYGTQRKDRLMSEHEGLLQGISNQRMGLLGQQQQSAQAQGQNINSTFGNIFQTWGEGGFDDLFSKS